MSKARSATLAGLVLLGATPVMGETLPVIVPDGVYPSPAVSVMVIHPDPACPGPARFRRDSIEYTEWANRKAVSTWTNTSETFLGCVDGDAPPDGSDPGAADPGAANPGTANPER